MEVNSHTSRLERDIYRRKRNNIVQIIDELSNYWSLVIPAKEESQRPQLSNIRCV